MMCISYINLRSSSVNGDPFSSLFFIILCALLSLIPAIGFKSFNDAVLILIGVVIFSYKFVLKI